MPIKGIPVPPGTLNICRPIFMPMAASTSLNIGAVNRCYYYRVTEGGQVSSIRLHVTVQSGNICVATYSNSGLGTSAVPTTRLSTSGSTACPAPGDNDISLGSTVTLSVGDWLAISADNTTATFLALGGAGNFTGVSGMQWEQSTAFPCPTNPATLIADNARMIAMIGIP